MQDALAEECERRRHVLIRGPMGWPMFVNRRFTMEECQVWWDAGFGIPLDLVPNEYWWIDNCITGRVRRFGEEMLGRDF